LEFWRTRSKKNQKNKRKKKNAGSLVANSKGNEKKAQEQPCAQALRLDEDTKKFDLPGVLHKRANEGICNCIIPKFWK